VDVHRELHLHGVGLLVGEGLHADDGLAFATHLHAPVDAGLAAGSTFTASRRVRRGLERLAVQFERDLHLFLAVVQVVVDVGREHHLVLLDEEPRRLQAEDEVLAGDDLGLALADRVPWPMPQTRIFQVVRFSGMVSSTSAVPFFVGGERADPEGGVGEVPCGPSARPTSPRRQIRPSAGGRHGMAAGGVRRGPPSRHRAPGAMRAPPARASAPKPFASPVPTPPPPTRNRRSLASSRRPPWRRTRRGRHARARFRRRQVVEPARQAVLGLRVVLPAPLPEELLDVGTFEPPEMYSTALS
jgi:hypothetical protein